VTLATLSDSLDLAGRVVFLRVDANVPLESGAITDDGRIRAFLPTLRWLTSRGAKVVLGSHVGRPSSAADTHLSVRPIALRTSELSGSPIPLVPAVTGDAVRDAIESVEPGEACFLENLRFDSRETSSAPEERRELAKEWASFSDVVVIDGFGVVHRKQASVYELPHECQSYAGFLIEKEVKVLEQLTLAPDHPYTVVLGGSKVSDKLGVIEALLPHIDRLVIGGGMVFTVLAAQGHAVGRSLLEADHLVTVTRFLSQAQELGVEVVLPSDIVMAESFSPDAAWTVQPVSGLESGPAGAEAMGLDIGPESAQRFANTVRDSRTVFWNGPMGVFEFDAFSAGTEAIATALTQVDGLAVVGGGDSAAAVRTLGFADDQFGHISTGGGASLEFLEGQHLPGLEILGWHPPVAP
jgi:phosphoglycerate kinase